MADDLFKKITTFIFDIDGVLTDGSVLVLENGLQARRMSIKDGFALQLAVKTGYRVLVVSGSSPSPVIERLNKLGINEVHMSVLNKKYFVDVYMEKNKLEKAEVLYKCDGFYNKEMEAGIIYNDPALNIDWKIPGEDAIVSDKDKSLVE